MRVNIIRKCEISFVACTYSVNSLQKLRSDNNIENKILSTLRLLNAGH